MLYTGAPGPADRGWNTDAAHFDKAKEVLAEVEKKFGNVELIQAQVQSAEQTAAALQQAGAGVPVLAMNLSCFAMRGIIQPVLDVRYYPAFLTTRAASILFVPRRTVEDGPKSPNRSTTWPRCTAFLKTSVVPAS